MSSATAAAGERRQVAAAVVLVCFSGAKRAGHERRALEARLRGDGDHLLATTVVGVDAAGKVSVRDPRRVLAGALTSALAWGIFGLVSGGWPSLLISAAFGAVWGGWMARAHAHHLTGAQLARAGARLPRDSSALLVFTDATDAGSVLEAAGSVTPTLASVASIADDLSATILPADIVSVASTDTQADRVSMVLVRYRDPTAADLVADRLAATGMKQRSLDVELVIAIDQRGRARVRDPTHGASAVARYNARSYAALGVVCGALAGLTGGDGFLGFLEGGLITGIAWGVFGAAAGALYGLWVGRSISARRLRPIAPLLNNNTSMLLAWTDAPPDERTLAALAAGAEHEQLVLSFAPADGGAVLTSV